MFLFDINRPAACRLSCCAGTTQQCLAQSYRSITLVPRELQNMTGSCCNELGLHQSTSQECIVSAAKTHAASIRRTLWLKEQKRANGRLHTCTAKITTPRKGGGENARKLRSRDHHPPTIDGPIYSTDYWRTWQTRSKARARPVSY